MGVPPALHGLALAWAPYSDPQNGEALPSHRLFPLALHFSFTKWE